MEQGCYTMAGHPAFERDMDRARRNVEKQNVAFQEAATVFDDPIFITFIDEEHSLDEERYITIGLSSEGRLLVLAHADREDRVRIISARRATKSEEQFYARAK